jgi:predicted AAA+ superfamily ATPase
MIRRGLSDSIERLSKKFPVLFITGPRQSGKTTLVKYVFPHYRYVNLEMLDQRSAAREDPRFFLSIGKSEGLILDEAQHVPELFSYIQGMVDNSREMGKFILTGSQNFLLLQKISQSLAGRAAVLHLHPFSFSEIKQTSFRKTDLAETLLTGWYPPIYDRGIEPRDFYPSYITTYVERDVREITTISDLTLFQRFIRLCAGRTGQLLNYSGLANDIGVNYKTVQSWIFILEASFIICNYSTQT